MTFSRSHLFPLLTTSKMNGLALEYNSEQQLEIPLFCVT